jgi:DNA-binding transcriptional ArsR family regulator/extradiol dioxygenase family protein
MHAFGVLGDPVRRRIVEVLAGGERTAGEVVAVVGGEFGITQSAVSQQLKVLRDHGFARVRPEGARRVYALDAAAIEAVDGWLRGVSGFWADRLEDLAAEVERRPPASAAAAGVGSGVGLGPIASVTRTVRDITESEAFYGTVLGLPRLATAGVGAAFDAGGTRVVLTQRVPPAGDESLLAFAVQDLAASVERLRAAGVEFRGQPRFERHHGAAGGEWVVTFDDPEGRPLALVARHAPPG